MEARIPLQGSVNQSLPSADGHLGSFWVGVATDHNAVNALPRDSHCGSSLWILPYPALVWETLSHLPHPSCLMGWSEAAVRESQHPWLWPTLSDPAATSLTWRWDAHTVTAPNWDGPWTKDTHRLLRMQCEKMWGISLTVRAMFCINNVEMEMC